MSKSQEWVKSHCCDLTDARFIRLTWAQRGIFDAAVRYSKSNSTVPGMFVRDDKPLALADIALGIGARNAGDQKTIADAFAAFVTGELMTQDARSGYHVADWDIRQSGTATEGREAWRRRQANKRARDAAAARRGRRTVTSNVTPLRPGLANRIERPDEEPK